MSKVMWMVRSGVGGSQVDACLAGGHTGLGFEVNAFPTLPVKPARDAVVKAFRVARPEKKEGAIIAAAGQFFRFLSEVQVGDEVLTYDSERRMYFLGTIASEPFRADTDDEDAMPFRRKVAWDRQIIRSALAIETRNTLGSVLTLFRIADEPADDVRKNAGPIGEVKDVAPPAAAAVAATADVGRSIDDLRLEVVQKSADFIADMITALDPYELQDLVAGILRAMGYKTRVSPKGADRGVDIFASPDGLGLQEPRIFVEVKHRPGSAMGSQELRSFLGGRKASDRCLYVSTGGFTKDARYEAERATIPLTLIDSRELQRLVREHYERLDEESRRLVPLMKIYWPIEHDS